MSISSVFDVQSRVIFCDQVRREDNGKLLFVGTYLDDFVVPTLPFDTSGISIHIAITVSAGAKRLPTYIRIVVPGYIDERQDIPFGDVLNRLKSSGHKEGVAVTLRQLPPFRIVDKADWEVRLGDDQAEEIADVLHVRTQGEVLGAIADDVLNHAALELFAGYCQTILPRIEKTDALKLSAYHVFDSLCHGRAAIKLNDENQPLWIVAGPRRMWVLNTQPWHAKAELDLRKAGFPIKYKEIERTEIGRLLELPEFVDAALHVVIAKKPEHAHA